MEGSIYVVCSSREMGKRRRRSYSKMTDLVASNLCLCMYVGIIYKELKMALYSQVHIMFFFLQIIQLAYITLFIYYFYSILIYCSFIWHATNERGRGIFG